MPLFGFLSAVPSHVPSLLRMPDEVFTDGAG